MKQGKLLVALGALPIMFAGCDIFAPDSLDPPGINLTGRVTFNGEPVPVRTPGGTQLRVWHTSWEKDDPERQPDDMGIHLYMDGSYSAMVYPGEYDLQLLENSGPWVNDTTRIPIVVNGDMQVDIPVQPYYTVEDESIVFTPPAAGDTESAGTLTATFRVGQHVTSQPVELVGLYVNKTPFVDQRRHEGSIDDNELERDDIQTQLDNNEPITITVELPADIRLTSSPDLRNALHARVGVKTQGVQELIYSQVDSVSIAVPQ